MIQFNHMFEFHNHQSDGEEEQEQVSDCESCISNDNERLFGDDLIPFEEDNAIFNVISHKFLSIFGSSGLKMGSNGPIIEAIHKVNWSYSHTLFARFQCFNIFREVINCTKYACYYDSKEGIQSIVSHGFGHSQLGGLHGIFLTPFNSLVQNMQNCLPDGDGLKHVLICQVLSESKESLKGLNEDEIVVVSPVEYVMSTKMNTHILPQYVVSFTTSPCLEGLPKERQPTKKPESSPRLPIATLISVLSKFLPQHTMNMIKKLYKEFKEGKISRQDLIKSLQQYAGRDVLIKIIKLCGAKMVSTH